MLTFDHARAAFRRKPSRQTAREYAAVAKDCFINGVLQADTLAAVAAELQAKGYDAAARFETPGV